MKSQTASLMGDCIAELIAVIVQQALVTAARNELDFQEGVLELLEEAYEECLNGKK